MNDDTLGAVSGDASDGTARTCQPAGAAIQTVMPGSPSLQARDVERAGVGDVVGCAGARVGCQRDSRRSSRSSSVDRQVKGPLFALSTPAALVRV